MPEPGTTACLTAQHLPAATRAFRSMPRTLTSAVNGGWAVVGAAAEADAVPLSGFKVDGPTVLVMGECVLACGSSRCLVSWQHASPCLTQLAWQTVVDCRMHLLACLPLIAVLVRACKRGACWHEGHEMKPG
jgi:hypothetical protein